MNFKEVREKAEAFGVELDWAVRARKDFLFDHIKWFEQWKEEAVQFLPGAGAVEREFIHFGLKEAEHEIAQCRRELDILENYKRIDKKPARGKITEDMVRLAKEHPVEDLLPYPVKGNKTRCPFHDDRNPSMWIKNNFAYCFACCEGWDSIGLVMKLEGLGFVEAVKRLA